MSNQHKSATYIRIKVSPHTISRAVDTIGKGAEVVMTLNGVSTGIKLKRAAERRYKVDNMLRNGRDVADIAGQIAGAFSKLFTR